MAVRGRTRSSRASSAGNHDAVSPLLLPIETSAFAFWLTWLIWQPGSFLLEYLSQWLLSDSGENSEELFFHSFSPYRHMFPFQVPDLLFLSFLPISWSCADPPGCASSWSPALFWTLAPSWSLWVKVFTTSLPLLPSALCLRLSLLPEQKGDSHQAAGSGMNWKPTFLSPWARFTSISKPSWWNQHMNQLCVLENIYNVSSNPLF